MNDNREHFVLVPTDDGWRRHVNLYHTIEIKLFKNEPHANELGEMVHTWQICLVTTNDRLFYSKKYPTEQEAEAALKVMLGSDEPVAIDVLAAYMQKKEISRRQITCSPNGGN